MTTCEKIDQTYKNLGYETGPKFYTAATVSTITGIALFIVACMGAAGTFPGGVALGWTAAGLAAGSFVTNLAMGNVKSRVSALALGFLVTATMVTVGALGAGGVLATTQIGWGILGTMFASIPFACLQACKQVCSQSGQAESPLAGLLQV